MPRWRSIPLGLLLTLAMAPRSRAEPLSSFGVQKVESLLTSTLPCLGCHTLHGKGGRLAPELSTVRQRRSAEYIGAMLRDPQAVVPGTQMPRPMLADRTRALLLRYLGGSETTGPVAPTPTGASSSGPELYARFCSSCHGLEGRGDGPNATALPVRPSNHTDGARLALRSDDALYDTIAGGGAIMNRSPRMPAFGATLDPTQITALVRHLRTLCRCEGPAWSR